jgi:hypothetical protein
MSRSGSTLSAMGSSSVAPAASGGSSLGARLIQRARAALAGTAPLAARVLTSIPGAAGALALAYGVGQIYRPLFWITVGVAGLLADRRFM